MGYSQYGDPNAYRGDPYRGAQTPANSEGSAMNVYSHAVPAQIPTPAPLVQNMQAAHQRTQSTGAPVNSAHITNMQHLYQQKSNQPQALNTQNYYQQHWTWQDYQQPVSLLFLMIIDHHY